MPKRVRTPAHPYLNPLFNRAGEHVEKLYEYK